MLYCQSVLCQSVLVCRLDESFHGYMSYGNAQRIRMLQAVLRDAKDEYKR